MIIKKILFILFLLSPSLSWSCDYLDKAILVLNGYSVEIDSCIAPIIIALNDASLRTISSCCGHGKTDGYILMKDMLIIISKERESKDVRRRYFKEFEIMSRENENITNRLKWRERNW